MRKALLFTALCSLALLAACGGGGGPANPGTGGAGFTNATFSGNYVFTMSGQCISACSSLNNIQHVQSAGYLVADGKGNITGGAWDLNIAGQYYGSPVSVTGSYSVNSDGSANVTLDNTVNTDSYVLMLSGPEGGSIVSNDSSWALAGQVQKQSTAAIATTPAGKYVFRAAGMTSNFNSWAVAGVMDFGTGNVTADMNQNGSLLTLATGSIASATYDNTTGRGTFTINPSGSTSLPTMNYVYYVVDANTLEIVSSDAAIGLQGRAEVTGGAVASPLTGSFAFLSQGFPVTGLIQVTEGGIFTGDGAGNITSGSIDTVFDNTGNVDASLTATGSVATVQGATRDSLILVPGSSLSMTKAVLWLANSGRGFFVTTNTDRAEAGTVNVQSGAPFTGDATFSFYQTGYFLSSGGASGIAYASLFKNNAGSITGYSQALNLAGSAGFNTGNGSLAFDSTGTIGSLVLNNTQQNGTEDIRFYQYSASQAFMMQADQGVITSGLMTVQTAQ